jgi:hypothetical protein
MLSSELEMLFAIMKHLTTFAGAVGLFSTCACAISLHKRTNGPPRVVEFPIKRIAPTNSVLRDQLRRRAAVEVALDNEVSPITYVEDLQTTHSHRSQCTWST